MSSSAADPTLERAFDAEERELCRRASINACRAGFLVVPAFALYDLVLFPNYIHLFIALRAITIAVLATVHWLLHRPFGSRHARALAWVGATCLGLLIVALTPFTKGRASPYYGGLNLVLLAITLFIPWPPRWSLLTSGGLIAAYVAVAVGTGAITDHAILFNNLFFLCTTAGIAFVSTGMQRALRRREFDKRVALRHALDSKREFVATISHELRTPLNAVIGYATILLDEGLAAGGAEARTLVERILDRGTALHRMISDLLDFAKLEAEKMSIHPGPVHVAEVARSLATGFEPLARRKNLELATRIDDTLPVVTSDRLRLEQILTNFIANAIKFTTHGTITLAATVEQDAGAWLRDFHVFGLPDRAALAGPHVVVSVGDTGIGIRPESIEGLAEDFRQVDDAASGTYGGTGLGLSVARRLARLLGGWVAVRSEYGRGSTFALVLPVPAVPLPAAA